ncbi:hypothetical protein [Halorussus sp. MSC15.2]|uniref:hypothetical protein n=1 Tax=Halorussus sp. MSC15.2 TaxID=2283638 RepID=UPI0013D7F4AA|nr:hypothetical protein [Halorussus sp. MSC15.2]NEU59199.1 hypothetical protein [Halorussus sp. MSC15.2]
MFEEDRRRSAVRVEDVLEGLVEGFERGSAVALGRPAGTVEVGLLERGNRRQSVVRGRSVVAESYVDRGVGEWPALVGEC